MQRYFGIGFGTVCALCVLALGMAAPAFAASADPNPVAFGSVPIGTSSTKTVTVTLDSGYQVIGATGAGINAPFSLNFDTCSSFVGPGTCTIKETYAPTAVGSNSGTLGLFVCPAAGGSCLPTLSIGLSGTGTIRVTTTTLTSSSNPSILGQPVTFTATVGATGGTPTGVVTFSDGSTVLGTVTLSGGIASITTSSLAAGAHTITASYGGDPTSAPSSATLTQTVQNAQALLQILLADATGVVPGKSLADKVRSIQAALAAGDTATACATLSEFLSQVQAQTGKSLTAAQAALLTSDARAVGTAIPC